MRAAAKVRVEGRITIPKSIRDDLELEYGDYVIVDVYPVEDFD